MDFLELRVIVALIMVITSGYRIIWRNRKKFEFQYDDSPSLDETSSLDETGLE